MIAGHQIPSETVRRIQEVLARFPEVEKAVLYGSRAKGNPRTGSDIDLTLFGEQLNSSVLARIDDALDDLLLPYQFDLSLFSQITNEDLIDHINRVGEVFYDKPSGTASDNRA
jgi:predicted nucleotidyltransferase